MKNISIILPVYNIEKKLIQRCMDSLLPQIDKEDEIILVDDGSDDRTSLFLDTYQDENVFVIHQENQGTASARNHGMNLAKKDYILFIDPDDYVIDNSFSKLKKYLETNADVYLFDYYSYKANEETKKYSFFKKEKVEKDDIHKSLLYDPSYVDNVTSCIWCGVPWAHAYKRTFLLENHLSFDPLCKRDEDNIFNMYVTDKMKTYEIESYAFYVYNMSHSEDYFSTFRMNMLDYLPYLSKLKTDFYYKKFSPEIDGLLLRYNAEQLRYLLDMYVFSLGTDALSGDRKKYYEKMRNHFPYTILMKEKSYLTKKQKLIVRLFSHNQYPLLRLVFSVNKMMKKR